MNYLKIYLRLKIINCVYIGERSAIWKWLLLTRGKLYRKSYAFSFVSSIWCIVYRQCSPFYGLFSRTKTPFLFNLFKRVKTTKHCPGVVKRLTCVPGQPRRVITSSVGGHTFYSDPSFPPKTVAEVSPHPNLATDEWIPRSIHKNIWPERLRSPWPRDDQSGQTICLIG